MTPTHPMRAAFLSEIGVAGYARFYRDSHFILAILAGFVFVAITSYLNLLPATPKEIATVRLVVVIGLWYPIVEELLFRGVIQGWLGTTRPGQHRIAHVTLANWITSLLFVGLHTIYQPAVWSVLIIVPSLLFGHLRDRHHSVYPSIALHAFYNLCFVLIPRF